RARHSPREIRTTGNSLLKTAERPGKLGSDQHFLYFDASRPPIRNRFQVGLMMISLMQTRGGRAAMKASVRPRSSGCSIFARTSGDGGTGRFSRIGVAASPGSTEVARRPWVHPSRLMDSVRAITARLVALYPGPVSVLA